MEGVKIMKVLHPISKGDNRYDLPSACYALTSREHRFNDMLKHVKVADGFASCIFMYITVKNLKISSLKSHDCHALMQ